MILCGVIGAFAGGGIGALIGYLGRCTSGACPFTATPYRGMFFGAVFGLLIALSYGCPWGGNAAYDKSAGEGGLLIESPSDFEKYVIGSTKPVLVDFYSPTCPPCRRLAPRIVSLKEKYSGRADVYKVDATEHHDLAARYRIQTVPTVSFLIGGKEVDRIVGLNYESVYAKVLDKLISSSSQKE